MNFYHAEMQVGETYAQFNSAQRMKQCVHVNIGLFHVTVLMFSISSGLHQMCFPHGPWTRFNRNRRLSHHVMQNLVHRGSSGLLQNVAHVVLLSSAISL